MRIYVAQGFNPAEAGCRTARKILHCIAVDGELTIKDHLPICCSHVAEGSRVGIGIAIGIGIGIGIGIEMVFGHEE